MERDRHYDVLDHTADLGLIIHGRDVRDLFSHAAAALFDTIVDLDTVTVRTTCTIAVTGDDLTDLFINFLRELLYLFHGHGFMVKRVDIHAMNETRLEGEASGETFDERVHTVHREIKAVTYHMAEATGGAGGWTARVILDV